MSNRSLAIINVTLFIVLGFILSGVRGAVVALVIMALFLVVVLVDNRDKNSRLKIKEETEARR